MQQRVDDPGRQRLRIGAEPAPRRPRALVAAVTERMSRGVRDAMAGGRAA
ncbi:hypothetical protein [Kitasatospora sp. NPDC015120]